MEVLQLQREMNAAMGWLLTTRASMDSHQRSLVSNTKTALHQNEVKATEAIKEVKAHCTAMIWDAEAMCAITIREAETTCVGHAHTLQQSLGESMLDLEHEAIEKEGQDHQSFLEACRVALQAYHPRNHETLIYPLQLLTGNMSLATLLATTPNWPLQLGNPTPQCPSNCVRDTPTTNGD